MVNVRTALALSEDSVSEGWIELKHLGIYTRPRNENGSVPVFMEPDYTSPNTILIYNKILCLLDIYDGWDKVEYFEDQIRKTGWLSPTHQCPNPYSTCN